MIENMDLHSLPPTIVSMKGKKLLLVDDERINRSILRKMLEPEGCVLEEADSAEDALQKYAYFAPDLVLCDVLLPGMNGFEACRELHLRHGANTAPVMFITAKQESDDIVEGFNAGGVDYVLKPFRHKEVIARIQTRLLLAQKQALVDELSRANKAKDLFLGMAAHDLRNPLASIRGFSEFMLDGTVGPLNAEQTDLVQMIHQASQGMVMLVNDLLDLATIESGEFKLSPSTVTLSSLIEKSIKLNAFDAAHKKTIMTFNPSDKTHTIQVDSAKIRQVIDNLLSNAIKYSPVGSTIRVTLEINGNKNQVIRVRDEGPGIPENEQSRLFTDFGRLSTQPTGGEKSVGLGLAICRKIVNAHQGSIEAENHPDGGCEFRISLPS
jgi:two-component system, sensor histidine kinase and response regulator